MNIDLLPFAAFALESAGARQLPRGERDTLTLRLTPAPNSSQGLPMGGRARIECVPLPSDSPLRAAVLPAEGSGLTITF